MRSGSVRHPLGMDVVVLSSRLFSIMQYGCNHVAAHAARDGVTPMGLHYRPPAGEPPLSEPFRLEAMERAWQATNSGRSLRPAGWWASIWPMERLLMEAPCKVSWRNALKAVITAYGKPYPKIHSLPVLAQHVQTLVRKPRSGCNPPLLRFPTLRGPRIYDSPDLGPDEALDHLFEQVEQDLNLLAGPGRVEGWI